MDSTDRDTSDDSEDDGANVVATGGTGLPTAGNTRFKSVPGYEGHVWLAGGASGSEYGLWFSDDSGSSFEKLPNVQEADTIGFGKAAHRQRYLALYASAKIDGVRRIFRSDDAGKHWFGSTTTSTSTRGQVRRSRVTRGSMGASTSAPTGAA